MFRFIEFFEGDNSRLSMTRLLCFLSFFPTAYVMVKTESEDMFAWFLSSFVTSYVLGKGADIFIKPKGDKDVGVTDTTKV